MSTAHSAWNPGLDSEIPSEIRDLCTNMRAENVSTPYAAVRELRDLTGLDASDLVAWRPARLALHELLIRVTANICVPDGEAIGDLGVNFRRLVTAIHASHIAPRMKQVEEVHARTRKRAVDLAQSQVAAAFASADGPSMVARWEKLATSGDPVDAAVHRALARLVSAIVVRHERLWGPRDVLASLAADMACNDAGSEAIGALIEPWVLEGAAKAGFKILPRQERPLVMNTKGPSASGKSTLRPLQKKLAGDIGVNWSDFALISPDIWRKQLLDYGTLGTAYRYGGSFTAEELQIVDQKLDRYMARKAEQGGMSHLLIDRFRFDSFAPDSDEAGSNLLTRFGRVVYLFFMVTSPESLVERAWKRGLDVGRYKAVDDTLAHAVEAYSGMPQLFFTWIQRTDKQVHFEFLDNSVRLGERPRTIAFGWNDTLNLLDVKCLLDVERYRRVDINATAPEFLYRDRSMLLPEHNTGFLRQCVDRFREINVAAQGTGRIYVRLVDGKPVWVDRGMLAQAGADPDTRAGLRAIAPSIFDVELPQPDRPMLLQQMIGDGRIPTLGRWGGADPS